MSLPAGTYIAIEGAIGSGKTSLAKIIAEHYDADLIVEDAKGNTFLKDFYRDPRRYALQAQLNFLLSRHRQQAEIRQINLFKQTVVTDYIFEKDAIFAYLNLDERELKLYNQVAKFLSEDITTPDMIVFLQSTPERLMTNILMRNIGYELEITPEYLKELCEAYHQFFFHWTKSPLLIINSSKVDFVRNEKHRDALIKSIENMQPGTTYLNPEV